MPKTTEACGRCSMSVVVDATESDEAEEGDATSRDPFAGERIEIDEDELDRVSPEAWLSRLSSRVDSVVTGFVWGR